MDLCHIRINTTNSFSKHVVFVSNLQNQCTHLTKYYFTNITFKTLDIYINLLVVVVYFVWHIVIDYL